MPIPGSDRGQSPRRISKLRPSPAMVVALIALFVAMGGASYAAARIGSAQIKNNSVRGKDIRNSTITGKDVKNKGLTGKDVKDDSLTGNDILESSLGKVPSAVKADSATTTTTASTATTATTANSVAANGVSSTSIQNGAVTASKLGTGTNLTSGIATNVAANAVGTASVDCSGGRRAIGGGGFWDNATAGAEIVDSYPSGANSWTVHGFSGGSARVLKARVLCLN